MSIPLPEVMLPISPGYTVLRLFQTVENAVWTLGFTTL